MLINNQRKGGSRHIWHDTVQEISLCGVGDGDGDENEDEDEDDNLLSNQKV